MENKTLPDVDKNIIFVYSEKDNKYLPEIKNTKKTELILKLKLLTIENNAKKLIEMIHVMKREIENYNKEINYEHYIDTKNLQIV